MQPARKSHTPTSQPSLDLVFNETTDFGSNYEQTLSSSLISGGIIPTMRDAFIQLALDETVPSWDIAQKRLEQHCKELGQTALEGALRREFDYFGAMASQREHLAPLCVALGVKTAADITSVVAQTHIPESYLAQVASALPWCKGPFDALRHLFENQAVHELVKGVFLEMRKEQPNVDVVHRLVTEARDTGQNLALSPQEQAGLMCLPYLTRIAVQDLLISCSDSARFAQALDATEKDCPEAKALDRLVATYAVANGHWNTLIERFTPSEDTVAAIAREALDKVHAFREAQEVLASDTGRALIARFFEVRQSTRDALAQHLRKLPPFQMWQQIDIGHFSSADYLHTLHEVSRDFDELHIGAVKCGEFAAVLEDDPEQRARYLRTVEQCSKFSLLPGGASACATPRELLALSKDPRVAYFILDIENGEHRHAGIDTAVTLLEEFFESQADITKPDRTLNIVIWSMSSARVKEATNAINDLLSKRPWGTHVNTNSRSCGVNLVKVETKLKTESPLGFF